MANALAARPSMSKKASHAPAQSVHLSYTKVNPTLSSLLFAPLQRLYSAHQTDFVLLKPGTCALDSSKLRYVKSFKGTTALVLDNQQSPAIALVSDNTGCHRVVETAESSADAFACTVLTGMSTSRDHCTAWPAVLARYNADCPSPKFREEHEAQIRAIGSCPIPVKEDNTQWQEPLFADIDQRNEYRQRLQQEKQEELERNSRRVQYLEIDKLYSQGKWGQAHSEWEDWVHKVLPPNVEDPKWSSFGNYAHTGQTRRLWRVWVFAQDGNSSAPHEHGFTSGYTEDGIPLGVGWPRR